VLKQRAEPVFVSYAKAKYGRCGGAGDPIALEMLFDRLCVRHRDFGTVTAESWHRDIYDGKTHKIRQLPRSLPGDTRDIITGGWTNLSDSPQYFMAILGSHEGSGAHGAQRGAEEKGGGFAVLSKTEIQAQQVEQRLASQAGRVYGTCRTDSEGRVVVPPGHMLVFFQRLLHAVAPQKKGGGDAHSLRYFNGFRLTRERVPLFQDQGRVIADGGVPRIPSGQLPPMFSVNHYIQFNKTSAPAIDKYRKWGERTFDRRVLFQRRTKDGHTYYTPGSPQDRTPSANRARAMVSLASYGMLTPEYRYSDGDIAVMSPQPLCR
jgi:hypothetical protein